MDRPLVTHLRRLSMDDGPGLRTTVFFKGCPLSCSWCHNPENIRPGAELVFFTERCIGCGACVSACPEGVLAGPGIPRLQRRERCTACGRCAAACPTTALQIAGRAYTAPELAEQIMRDRAFYAASGGGVTFSGGEPTLFPDYLALVLQTLKADRIHVAIETAGLFAWKVFATKLLPHIDLVLYDLKLFDPGDHHRHTGRRNERIRANFIRLCDETAVEVVPRVPLVPGITATSRNLAALARFVAGRRCGALELLPYNPAGLRKRRALGETPDPALPNRLMTGEEEREARAVVTRSCGARTTAGASDRPHDHQPGA